jgi:acyl-coenzyme A synthetase/AMP-(fatty) acid ligase
VKSVVFGARRGANVAREGPAPLDAALAPAFSDGRWHVPGRFNFTRDVVEVLALDSRRQAFTFVGRDGVIEPRSFQQLSDGAARWATYLREHGVTPEDRVLVVLGASPEWPEIMLGCIKVGAVAVPCSESLSGAAVEIRIAAVGARVVIAANRDTYADLQPATGPVTFLGADEMRHEARRLPKTAPTADTSSGDPALVVWTGGRTNGPRGATHTHQATFAARLHAEHWLDAGPGDVVWCSAPVSTGQALWSSLFGPWSRGAEVVLNEAPLDPADEIELVRRLRVTTLCRTPGEYAVLAESDRLEWIRTERLRRLVATGSQLPEVLIEMVEERTGLAIHDGYGQAETGIVIAHTVDGTSPRGSIGQALPGYDIAVIDEHGRELPAGEHGDIALRGTAPSLFSGYWNAPKGTKSAYRGDWYVTGDAGARDAGGFFWLARQASDLDARATSADFDEAPSLESQTAALERPAETIAAASAERETVSTPEPTPRVALATHTAAPEAEPDLRARPRDGSRARTPLWARLTAAVWIFLLGLLVGGTAIPHASDTPRVAPQHTSRASAICLTPKS